MLAGARGFAAFGVLVAPALSACGTYVPNIQEFGPSHVGQLLVQDIVHSVHCEVTNAIIEAVGRPGAPGSQNAEFMSDWGVQMTLTLTVDEKSSLSPNVVWTPSAFFSLGGGLSGAADAARTDKLNFFYSVDQLRRSNPCPTNRPTELAKSLLIQNDLKLAELLDSEIMAVGTLEVAPARDPKNSFGQDVISHDVKFDVTTGANITPGFTIHRVSVDGSPPLFSATRERTHDLTITLGPIDPDKKDSLIPAAQNVHLSQLLQTSFSNALQQNRAPVSFSLFP